MPEKKGFPSWLTRLCQRHPFVGFHSDSMKSSERFVLRFLPASAGQALRLKDKLATNDKLRFKEQTIGEGIAV